MKDMADESTPFLEGQIGVGPSRSRWRGVSVVLGGMLIHITFGTVYTFGNMTPYMTSYMRLNHVSGVTYADSVWIFSCMVIGTGVSMYFGGFLERRIGPRLAALVGCTILSVGVLLTHFTIRVSFGATLATYGLMFGMGKGIGYAIPLACAMRWYPERKGFVSGLVVAGVGGGSFIFDQIQTAYLNPGNERPNFQYPGETDKYFKQADILHRVPSCFLLLGGIYVGMQLVGVALLANPTGYSYQEMDIPEKSDSPIAINRTDVAEVLDGVKPFKVDVRPSAMLKTATFYNFWFILLFIEYGIVFVSSLWKAYGQTFIHDDHFLAYVGAFSSACNAMGRIMWGYLGDRFSFKVAMLCLCTSFSVLILTLEFTKLGGKPVFFIWVCLIFLSFSGTFSLLPAATAKIFGSKYYSMNYGLVCSAECVAGVIGALMTSELQGILGWDIMFFTIAVVIWLALALTYRYRPPNEKSAYSENTDRSDSR